MTTKLFNFKARWLLVPLVLLTLGVGNAWGALSSPSACTFASGSPYTTTLPDNNTDVTWTATTAPAEFESSGDARGLRWGGATVNATGGLTISCSTYNSYTITQIDVVWSRNNTAGATVSAKVNGSSFGSSDTNSAKTVNRTSTFTGSASGTIEINATSTASGNSFYLKSITVTYSAGCGGTKLGTPIVTASFPASNRIDLSWSAVSNASSYQLKWNGGDWVTATSPVSKTGLTNGTSYTYQVRAIGNGSTYCDGDASAEASAIPGTYYTVTFMCNGSTYDTKSIRSGQNLELPDNPSSCMAGKEFVGWATAAINGSTNTKPTFVSTFTTISSNKTYYAVFATKTANSYSLGDVNDLIEGQKVLIVNRNSSRAMSNSNATNGNGKLDATSVSISDNKITSPGSELIWTVELDEAKYKFKNSYYVYAYSTNTNTSLYCDNDDSDYPDSWTVTYAGSTGNYYLYSNRSTSSKKLEYYTQSSKYFFTTYTAGTDNNFKHSFFVPTYTAYVTSCCTELGSINGSFLWTAVFYCINTYKLNT